MIRFTALGAVVFLLSTATTASAAGPRWQYRVVDTVKPGQKAELVLVPQNTVHGVVLRLTPDRGRPIVRKVKRIAAGTEHRLRWTVPTGVSVWQGELIGSAEGATSTAPLKLRVVSAKPLDVRLRKRDVDLAAARVVVQEVENRARSQRRTEIPGAAEMGISLHPNLHIHPLRERIL